MKPADPSDPLQPKPSQESATAGMSPRSCGWDRDTGDSAAPKQKEGRDTRADRMLQGPWAIPNPCHGKTLGQELYFCLIRVCVQLLGLVWYWEGPCVL